MTRPLVIVGAGGFGREVFGIVQRINALQGVWTLEGFIDDAPSDANGLAVKELGSSLLGSLDVLRRLGGPIWAVAAIGAPEARAKVVRRLDGSAVQWATLVHPDATVGPNVSLGDGSIVAPGARLSTNITIGRHVHVDQNATVGHDSVIGDFSRLNPQACISGSVSVGALTTIGANATVLQGLVVGEQVVVGAGAVVTRPVAPAATVIGVPAR